MPIESKQMNANIKAVTVDGILSPMAMRSAMMNLEMPKNNTWTRIGNLAFLRPWNISLIGVGIFHLRTLMQIITIAPMERIKNPKLSKKLTTFKAVEFDFHPTSPILTRAAINKS